MDRTVEEALQAPADYSQAFTSEVERLTERARDALASSVEHSEDMNYSSSQQLVVGLDEFGRYVRSLDPASVVKIVAYVSSKAKLFALRVFKAKTSTRAAKEWFSADDDVHEPAVSDALRRISRVLETEGYRELSGATLRGSAGDRVTEMDGAPATVFDVLFTEIT